MLFGSLLKRMLMYLIFLSIFYCFSTFFYVSPCFSTKITGIEDFSGVVVRVSDGDTIWVQPDTGGKKVKIRVWGIDTPEKFKSKKLYWSARICGVTPGKVKHLGERASGFARRILKGKKVRVEVKGIGKYGRPLAKIIILPEEEDYGLKTIKEGYSCIYRKTTDREYIEAMEEAKRERKGLWNVNFELMNCLCY